MRAHVIAAGAPSAGDADLTEEAGSQRRAKSGPQTRAVPPSGPIQTDSALRRSVATGDPAQRAKRGGADWTRELAPALRTRPRALSPRPGVRSSPRRTA